MGRPPPPPPFPFLGCISKVESCLTVCVKNKMKSKQNSQHMLKLARKNCGMLDTPPPNGGGESSPNGNCCCVPPPMVFTYHWKNSVKLVRLSERATGLKPLLSSPKCYGWMGVWTQSTPIVEWTHYSLHHTEELTNPWGRVSAKLEFSFCPSCEIKSTSEYVFLGLGQETSWSYVQPVG